ncbi:hypothetical protein CXG81DRAFT_28332 [Caulochytrium protostelioides]|uniref:Uncharacterized protein n=1 Tax=Caulochytrium protostelioides TaxID=1555241 RepID=A0A4P9WU18_9FUNG|nr:hypothetical protein CAUPRSCDRAFT_11527 [Caulochytrium protostelioides]RKO98869.1 hypothetical protein CXG81DRAFT_28332 [Caulochytrium protostelioides]|eukprot:RKO98869.1 hypothetical protein CXG81DRAFT_28332 [Caulochytrium protostelioides]
MRFASIRFLAMTAILAATSMALPQTASEYTTPGSMIGPSNTYGYVMPEALPTASSSALAAVGTEMPNAYSTPIRCRPRKTTTSGAAAATVVPTETPVTSYTTHWHTAPTVTVTSTSIATVTVTSKYGETPPQATSCTGAANKAAVTTAAPSLTYSGVVPSATPRTYGTPITDAAPAFTTPKSRGTPVTDAAPAFTTPKTYGTPVTDAAPAFTTPKTYGTPVTKATSTFMTPPSTASPAPTAAPTTTRPSDYGANYDALKAAQDLSRSQHPAYTTDARGNMVPVSAAPEPYTTPFVPMVLTPSGYIGYSQVSSGLEPTPTPTHPPV